MIWFLLAFALLVVAARGLYLRERRRALRTRMKLLRAQSRTVRREIAEMTETADEGLRWMEARL